MPNAKDPTQEASDFEASNPEFWRQLVAAGDFRFRVSSDSMSPTLVKGDKVLVQALPPMLPEGQITVFVNCERLTVHRHLGNRIFCGDNLLVPDREVPQENLVGIAVDFLRNDKLYPLSRKRSFPVWRQRLCLRLARFATGFLRGLRAHFRFYNLLLTLWKKLVRRS